MRILIHKCSVPGWTKEFTSVRDALKEVRSHICMTCLKDDEFKEYRDSRFDLSEKPSDWSDWNYMGALLGTSCGCEYEREILD